MKKWVGLMVLLAILGVSSANAAEVMPNGLVQTWLASGVADDDATPVDADNEFLMRRARAGLKAKVNDLVSAKVQLDGVTDTDIIDAEASLHLHPLAKVRLGKMKYDFDIGGRTSSKALPFPTRPIPTRALAGLIDSGPGSFRMQGAQLMGDTDLGGMSAGYVLGVFNGQSVTDEDDGYATLVNLHANPIEELKVNLAYLTEETSDDDTDTVWTIGLHYVRGGWGAGAEYYAGEVETAGGSVDPAGYYAFLTYRMGQHEVGGRYQVYDTDVDATGEITSIDLKYSFYLGEGKGYKAPKITILGEIRDADDGYDDVGALTYDEKGTATIGEDVDNVILLELSIPL